MPYARKDNISWVSGSYYHIYNRGARQVTIFREETNYLFVLSRMKKYLKELQLAIIAYCLMPNHYHLVLKQNSTQPLNSCVQLIFNSYTKAINKRYRRCGTLFEGRFKAKEIYEEQTILEVCRYVHRNPLDDGLVNKIEDWEYSNYHEWVGIGSGKLCDYNFSSKHFPDQADYKKYVLDYYSYKQVVKDLKKLGYLKS